MKTKYWIMGLAAVLVVCLALSVFILLPGEKAEFAEITSNGRVVKTVDLSLDQEFTVPGEKGGSNTVTVRGGKIAVTAASCPDHICMARGYCDSGTPIVCLPNSLIIRFLSEQAVDGAVG